MKLLILGANGQVGYCLKRIALANKLDFMATTRDDLDVSDPVALDRIVASYCPDFIINATAYTNVERAQVEIKKAYEINAEAVVEIGRIGSKYDIPVIHISTDYIFDGKKEGEYSESDHPCPINVYGKSKLDGENGLIEIWHKHIILRTSWIFGEHGKNFVKTMLRLFSSQSQVAVVDDQIGAPTYAGDLANAILTICHKIKNSPESVLWGIYNFAGNPSLSWYDFAVLIQREALQQNLIYNNSILKKISSKDYPSNVRRPANSRLSLSKINYQFGIKPSDWQREIKIHLQNYL